MSFLQTSKQVGSVVISESGKAIAVMAMAATEFAATAYVAGVCLNEAIYKEIASESKAKIDKRLAKLDIQLGLENAKKTTNK